jgi:NAD(P)-dependent dehydrogenase (short-subunit alcohol dehydrogenase family)
MPASRPLEGRTVLVTGGAGGIGAACAHALEADGATVVLMTRRRVALEHPLRQLTNAVPGGRVEIQPGGACLEQIPLGTAGDDPAAIAQAVRYLAGPESGWVTGQRFAVDGGHELRTNPRLDATLAHRPCWTP